MRQYWRNRAFSEYRASIDHASRFWRVVYLLDGCEYFSAEYLYLREAIAALVENGYTPDH